MGKLRTWEADEDEYRKFKEILVKEHLKVGEKINEFIKKFNLEYGDGNPVYELDQWFDNEKMLAIPAHMREKPAWLKWILACQDEDLLQGIMGQSQMITSLVDKRILEIRGHSVTY